jgi:NAD dependent epimerase/dehydratase family enzyme
MIEWAIETDSVRGVYNATAPHPATNRDFARALAAALHRPALLPTPAFALRLAFGREMADEMLLGGQRVLPARAQREGFSFEYPTLERSLAHQLRR